MNKSRSNEAKNKDMEVIIGYVLRTGVIVSISLALIDLIIIFTKGSINYYTSSYQNTFSFLNLIFGHFSFLTLLFIPIIILIITPVTRVLLSIFLFLKNKDYILSITTLTVFIILLISIFIVA
ncbi:MAG: DUF1634 domain-containing protein [Patescibacteria group bacterium]